MILEKQTSNVNKVTITIILQIAVVLLAVTVLAILIRAPLTEGRAANMDLISIYADPFYLIRICYIHGIFYWLATGV